MTNKKKPSLLKDLIHSLEPGEKRYVSINLDRFKAGNDYLKIFNAILFSSPDTESNNLSEISKNIAVIKVQLYWKILRILQQYKSENNPEIKKNDLLSQYAILEEKGLTDQALKVLNYLSEFCKEHQFTDDLLYIERKKIRIHIEHNDQQKKEHYLSLFNRESLKNIKAINQVNTLLKIYYQNKLNLQFFSLKIDLNAVKIINSYVNRLKEEELLSENAMFFYHFNKSIYYVLTGNIKEGLLHLKKTINSVFGAGNQKVFYSVHQNDILDVLFELVYVNQIDTVFKKMILEIEQQLLKARGDITRFQLFKLEVECYLNWKNGDLKEFTASHHKLLKFNREQHYDIYKTSQPINTVRVFVENREYKKCWFFINNLTKAQTRLLKFEIQLTLKLLKLVLSILLSDFSLVKTEMKNLKAFVGSTGISSGFCNSVISMAEQLIKLQKKQGRPGTLIAGFKARLADVLTQDDYKINYEKIINFNKLIMDTV